MSSGCNKISEPAGVRAQKFFLLLRLNNADVLSEGDLLHAVDDLARYLSTAGLEGDARTVNGEVVRQPNIVCRDEKAVSRTVREIVDVDSLVVSAVSIDYYRKNNLGIVTGRTYR